MGLFACNSSLEYVTRRPYNQLKLQPQLPVMIDPDHFNYQKYFDIALKLYQQANQQYLLKNREDALRNVIYSIDLLKKISIVEGMEFWQIVNVEEMLNTTVGLYEKIIKNIYDEHYDNSGLIVSRILNDVVANKYAIENLEKWERYAKMGIPYAEDERVNEEIHRFSIDPFFKNRSVFKKWIYRSGYYAGWMTDSLYKAGLPDELLYLCMIESGFSPFAFSPATASGLWQFMRGTAKSYHLNTGFWIDERRDPYRSTQAAIAHLKDLQKVFNNWYLSMAAYNCGQRKVERSIARHRQDDYWQLSKLPKETRQYVPRFLAVMRIARNMDDYGFTKADVAPALNFEVFPVDKSLRLSSIALAIGTTTDELKLLNPELIREQTPPDYTGYQLRLPFGKAEQFARIYPSMKAEPKKRWHNHVVRKGDNLWSIAKKYKVSQKTLCDLNKITSPKKLKPGRTLLIPLEMR